MMKHYSDLNKLGWAPKISLRDGLAGAYADFLSAGQHRTA
jgi:nucleoside-diphosphate-sugar epimerase